VAILTGEDHWQVICLLEVGVGIYCSSDGNISKHTATQKCAHRRFVGTPQISAYFMLRRAQKSCMRWCLLYGGVMGNVEKNNRNYGMWGYMECGVQPADSNKYHPWPSPPPVYSQWAQIWELRKVRVGQVPTRIQNRVLIVSWFCLSLLPWLTLPLHQRVSRNLHERQLILVNYSGLCISENVQVALLRANDTICALLRVVSHMWQSCFVINYWHSCGTYLSTTIDRRALKFGEDVFLVNSHKMLRFVF